MDKKQLYAALNAFCQIETEEDAQNPPENLAFDAVWGTLLDIAQNEPHVLGVYFPLLVQFALSFPDFKETTTTTITSALEKVAVFEDLKPLLMLMPFLSLSTTGNIFGKLIELIGKELAEKFPVEVVKVLRTVDDAALSGDVLGCLCDVLAANQENPAAIIAFAPFSRAATNNEETGFAELASEIIMNNLKAEKRENKMAALYLLEEMAPMYAMMDLPKGLFEKLSLFLVDADENIMFRAHKAMRKLIEATVFENEVHIKAVISKFDQYTEAKLPMFFKLMERFLENNTESPKMKVLQVIYDFVAKKLNDKDAQTIVKAKTLECITQMAAMGKHLVDDFRKPGLALAEDLIKSKCFTEPTNYMLAMSKLYPDELSRIKNSHKAMVNSLVDCETGSKKQRMERAESLASFTDLDEAIVTDIIQFISQSIDTIQGGEIFYICSALLAMKSKLTPESADMFMTKLQALAIKEVDGTKFNAILHTMKKLLKKTTCDVSSFITSILDGKIAFLGDLPLSSCQDDKTMIFYFLAACIRKSPLSSGRIAHQIIDMVPEVTFGMLPAILEPVEASLHTNVIDHEHCKKLYKTVMDILDKLVLTYETEVCACVEIISMITKSHPDIIDPSAILNTIMSLVGVHGEEEDEEMDVTESTAFPSIARFTLELLTSKGIKAQVDAIDSVMRQTLLTFIINPLPLGPEVAAMEDIMLLIAKVAEDPQYSVLLKDIMIVVSEFLILKKPEMDEYGFSDDTKAALTDFFKATMAANKGTKLTKDIDAHFRRTKQKFNRYTTFCRIHVK